MDVIQVIAYWPINQDRKLWEWVPSEDIIVESKVGVRTLSTQQMCDVAVPGLRRIGLYGETSRQESSREANV